MSPKNPSKRGQSSPPISTALRVAIYHRVSTLDQDPKLARVELESWVARNGGHVALRVEENASGAWNARPGLQRVLEAARRGEIDVVLTWKLDRWGRSSLDVLANIEALTNAGVRFVAVTQGLDVKPAGDAMSKLILSVLAGVSEFERSLIRERTILGLQKAKREGKQLGRPRRRGPAPDVVRELRAQGKSWPAIAESLNCSVGIARLRATEGQRKKRGIAMQSPAARTALVNRADNSTGKAGR